MSIHLGTALPEQVCDPINEPEQESPRQPQQKECPIATEITHRLQIPAVIGRNGSVDVGGVSLSCDNFCHESLCCVLCSYVASLRSSVTDRSSRTSVYFITDESTNTRLRRWMNPQLSDDKSTETDHLIIGVTSKANAFQTVLCDSQGFSFWDRNTSEEIQLGTLRLFKCQIPNPNLPEPGLDTLAYIAKQAKQWIDLCDTHHDYCRSLRSNLTPSISLIDCNRYCLVRGFEGARYVALSYVWGDTGRAFNLPERRYGLRLDGLPRTISDAIVVTKSLGYDYIWVDMLCIDQQNKEDKHRQIAIMDQVYRSADLTIIVTAGSDCGNGIPGVSKTCRAPRMSTTIGGLTLVEEKEDAIREVELSFWRLRGWTFQEGLLSRRRLVFTNSQMLFSCVCGVVIEPNEGLELSHNCQSIPESMIWPPGEDMLWDRLFLQTESNPRTTLIGNGNKAKHDYGFPISFAELLEKYSTMQFSFESDVVDAFRAISNTFAQRKPPVLHLYGLPFISGDESITSSSLTRGLAWCLKRDNEETARRPGFPSWSWLGYRGPVRWGAMKREGPIFPVDRQWSDKTFSHVNSMITTSNRRFELSQLPQWWREWSSGKASEGLAPSRLIISGAMIKPEIWTAATVTRNPSFGGYVIDSRGACPSKMRYHIGESRIMSAEACHRLLDNLRSSSWRAILLTNHFLLIIHPVADDTKDGLYRRVSSADIDVFHSEKLYWMERDEFVKECTDLVDIELQ